LEKTRSCAKPEDECKGRLLKATDLSRGKENVVYAVHQKITGDSVHFQRLATVNL